MSITKTRTTDFRATSPSARREAATAESWIAGLSTNALRGIAHDLSRDFSHDRKDPAQRWKMARKGAVLRQLTNTRLL